MKSARSLGRLTIFLGLALLCVVVEGGSPSMAGADNPRAKEIVGKWEGSLHTDMGNGPLKITLRTAGAKIVGEFDGPHGVWDITGAKFANGKWTIDWRNPEGTSGNMVGTVKGDKLTGNFKFGEGMTGTFELTRVK